MRIEALTFLRFIAASCVVIFHYGGIAKFPPSIRGFLMSGPQMVTFFFVLSGFAMTLSYYSRDNFNVRYYWITRIVRIYPLYLITLVISIYFFYGKANNNAIAILLNLFLLQSWISPYPISMNFPAWALSVLAFFYLSFPLLLSIVKRTQLSSAMLLTISIFLWFISQIILTFLLNSKYFVGYPSFLYDLIYFCPISHFCSFIIGIAGALFVINYKDKINLSKYFTTFVTVSMFIFVFLILNNGIALNNFFGFKVPFGSSFLAPLFLFLILSISFSNNFITKLLSIRPLVMLGNISFALYILQTPMRHVYKSYIAPSSVLGKSLDFYLYYSFLILTSVIFFYLLENPLNTWTKIRLSYYQGG